MDQGIDFRGHPALVPGPGPEGNVIACRDEGRRQSLAEVEANPSFSIFNTRQRTEQQHWKAREVKLIIR